MPPSRTESPRTSGAADYSQAEDFLRPSASVTERRHAMGDRQRRRAAQMSPASSVAELESVQADPICGLVAAVGRLTTGRSRARLWQRPPLVRLEAPQNCVDEIRSFLGTKVYIVAGLALGVAVIMIFGMIFSMAVCCAIRNDSPY
ncbi:unnamed protein product [Lampetra planeri]